VLIHFSRINPPYVLNPCHSRSSLSFMAACCRILQIPTSLIPQPLHRSAMICAAAGCSVLLCVALCCGMLQCVAVCCKSLHLPYTARHCKTLQDNARHCNTLQVSTSSSHCNTLQHTATHCNTLQHTATHCKSLHLQVLSLSIAPHFIFLSFSSSIPFLLPFPDTSTMDISTHVSTSYIYYLDTYICTQTQIHLCGCSSMVQYVAVGCASLNTNTLLNTNTS